MTKRAFKILVILIFISLAMSCRHKPVVQPAEKTRNDLKPPVVTTGIVPPVVHPLINPIVVKAGAPVIQKDSLNGGAPFITNFSADEGIGSSNILCIYQDKLGNIWFGSQGGGACRYDGRNFINYTTVEGLASNTVSSIIQDKSGNMWFATQGGGLSRYDGKGISTYTIAQGLGGNIVTSIMEDKAGHILVSTQRGGISEFDGKKFVNFRASSFPGSGMVNCMIQDRAGDIWFGTYNNGVSIYDGKKIKTLTKAQGLADDGVYSLLQDKAGNIWIGTPSGITKYDGKTWFTYTTAQGLPDNNGVSITQDINGDLWFLNGGPGITRFDGTKFTFYAKKQGLSGSSVNAIFADSNGSIWLGYATGGASRLDLNGFTKFSPQNGQVGTFGNKIIQDKAGDIWFATAGGGVLRYDGKSFDNYNQAQGLAGSTVLGMMQDKVGNLWFGTDGGATKYDGTTFTNYAHDQGLLTGDAVHGVMQDKSGNIWFGTWGRGISRFDGKSFINYTTAQGLPLNIVDVMTMDKAGNIWFCSGNGVSKFDGQKFINYNTDQGLAGNIVISTITDKAGNVWFGTDEGGISRYDGKTFLNNSTTNWVNGQGETYAIAKDTLRNRIWLGTTQGLSWISPGTSKDSYTSGTLDPALDYPVKNVQALLVDKQGILWAGCGDNTIVRIDYEAVLKKATHVNLQIKAIQINGKNMCWNYLLLNQKNTQQPDQGYLQNEMGVTYGRKLSTIELNNLQEEYRNISFDSIGRFYPVPSGLRLPYADRNVTIDYIAIAPDWPKRIKYSYKLTGYDKDWSTPSNFTTAVFGNIPEGAYTFEVKAIGPEGTMATTDYSFTILPPWYRAWWAWLFYIIAAIGAIWAFVYFRSRRLVAQKRALENTVQLRTEEVLHQKLEIEEQRDELETAFKELKTTQNQLIQAEKMASLGELTAGIAHEIQNPLNFVNNFSEVSRELIAEMQEELLAGHLDDVSDIAGDLGQNLEKIYHHGKRAQGIVTGMMAHSRSSSGLKEQANINKMAEEYLKLAYHGLQSKDKNFQAELVTHFDENLPPVKVVPQDIGSVLVNLYNNAFYAVNQKAKTAGADYKPGVVVTTSAINDQVMISVKDNGTGIPDAIKSKIMQPFFTTKPTGEGSTGLGLSLIYDMVVKGHNGTIEVNSKEGEGSEFLVSLPV